MKKFHKPKAAAGSESRSRRHRRHVRIGQLLMAAGALVAISPWFAHLAPAGQGPGSTEDIFIGAATAGALLLVGAGGAGRTENRER